MTFGVLNHQEMQILGDEQFRINLEHKNDQIIKKQAQEIDK